MQISSVNFNSFKGNNNQIIEMEPDCRGNYRASVPDKYEFTKEREECVRQVADSLDKTADKTTTPLRYFLISSVMAGLAFIVGKKATSRVLKYGMNGSTKPLPKFINGLRDKVSSGCLKLMNKIKNTTMRSGFAKFVKFGENAFDGVSPEHLKTIFTGTGSKVKQSILGAINKTLALGAGVGAATYNLSKRYEDKNNNGVPDRAERALSLGKEVLEGAGALLDAAGVV